MPSVQPSDFVNVRSPLVVPSLHNDSPSVLAATGVLPSLALYSAPTLFGTPHGSYSRGDTPAFEMIARGSLSQVPSNVLDLNLSVFTLAMFTVFPFIGLYSQARDFS